MIEDRDYAAQHSLPRVVWSASGFRVVQYLDDYGRVAVGLEVREGMDFLGHHGR